MFTTFVAKHLKGNISGLFLQIDAVFVENNKQKNEANFSGFSPLLMMEIVLTYFSPCFDSAFLRLRYPTKNNTFTTKLFISH